MTITSLRKMSQNDHPKLQFSVWENRCSRGGCSLIQVDSLVLDSDFGWTLSLPKRASLNYKTTRCQKEECPSTEGCEDGWHSAADRRIIAGFPFPLVRFSMLYELDQTRWLEKPCNLPWSENLEDLMKEVEKSLECWRNH